ncbi:hypothetical protein RFI02_16905 [Acinetobacter sichuanensis]|uniref:hypothetical protein n=1 Tax=Acinetobacter sichuanensis TaxID=2136183 RepID=UPI00280EC6E6|nr:hypothetical protein [Acinetobacter sichuanensis]MDQ9022786.1 hypothetical protein [Acinetobacter sichuanensis]
MEFVMEFPENIAKQLDGDSMGAIRAWRHQVICKLIEAGVVDPEEIKQSVDSLYKFVVSPVEKVQEGGVIPAGTRFSIWCGGLTLKHDTEVLESQEIVDDNIARRLIYEGNGNLILSESLKNKSDSKHP